MNPGTKVETYEILLVEGKNTKNLNEKLNSEYSVTFRVNDKCNLGCEYCHWKDGINYDTASIFRTIDKLVEFFVLKKFKVCTLYFHGGEPSFHPDIDIILKYIRAKTELTLIIEFQTNLTLDYGHLYDLVDYFSVSYHYLELKKHKKLKKFKENILSLPKDKLLHLDLMLENVPAQELDFFYDECKEYLSLPFTDSEMIYGFCHYEYNDATREKHLKFYKEHNETEHKFLVNGVEQTTNDLFKDGIDCTGMICDAGKETIVVNGDGNVFICGIHMTNYTNRCADDIFTNIINDKNAIKKLQIISKTGYKCQWNYCGGDFYIDKN